MKRSANIFPLAFLFFLVASSSYAQNLFTTARTNGFGSPSLLVGFSFVNLDPDHGEDVGLFLVRGSVGIGRKTDVFGSLNRVNGRGLVDANFLSWTAGLHHQFIRSHIVDVGAIVQLRGNHVDKDRFEDSLLDFVGIISIEAAPFHPYYALIFSRPFGFSLSHEFQKSSAIGVEIPLGDVPRIFGEIGLGDRRSYGAALKLAF